MVTAVRELNTRVPDDYIVVATDWYSGMNSMLYAIASTGHLKLGNRRPYVEDSATGLRRRADDAEWFWTLYSDLATELRDILRSVPEEASYRYADVTAFMVWAEETASQIYEAYGIDI